MSKSTTKKAIAFALKDLLSEKPLDKITINDIAEKAEINRRPSIIIFRISLIW